MFEFKYSTNYPKQVFIPYVRSAVYNLGGAKVLSIISKAIKEYKESLNTDDVSAYRTACKKFTAPLNGDLVFYALSHPTVDQTVSVVQEAFKEAFSIVTKEWYLASTLDGFYWNELKTQPRIPNTPPTENPIVQKFLSSRGIIPSHAARCLSYLTEIITMTDPAHPIHQSDRLITLLSSKEGMNASPDHLRMLIKGGEPGEKVISSRETLDTWSAITLLSPIREALRKAPELQDQLPEDLIYNRNTIMNSPNSEPSHTEGQVEAATPVQQPDQHTSGNERENPSNIDKPNPIVNSPVPETSRPAVPVEARPPIPPVDPNTYKDEDEFRYVKKNQNYLKARLFTRWLIQFRIGRWLMGLFSPLRREKVRLVRDFLTKYTTHTSTTPEFEACPDFKEGVFIQASGQLRQDIQNAVKQYKRLGVSKASKEEGQDPGSFYDECMSKNQEQNRENPLYPDI